MKTSRKILRWGTLGGVVVAVWIALGLLEPTPWTEAISRENSPAAASVGTENPDPGQPTPPASLPAYPDLEGASLPTPPAVLAQAREDVAAFDAWWAERKSTPDAPLTAEDAAILSARRAGMKTLIEGDADAALAHMLPLTEYAAMPEEVRQQIETPVARRLTVDVLPRCLAPDLSEEELARVLRTVPAVRYHASVDDENWSLYPARERAGFLSKNSLPVFGVRVEQSVAVHDSPLRLLQPGEDQAARLLFPLEETSIGDAGEIPLGRPVLVGDQLIELPTADEYQLWEEVLREAESLPGPDLVEDALEILLAPNPPVSGLEAIRETLRLAASTWTETPKRMLFIRVDFPDRPGGPAPVPTWEANTAETAQIFSAWSYNKTTILPTISSKIYRLQNTSQYTNGENLSLLMTHARAAAAADYNLSNFDIFVVCAARIFDGWWAGMASVGGPNQWLNGFHSTGLIVHETGHNYGVFHANWWKTAAGENAASVRGENIEYGDPFDEMGGTGEFNMRFKNRLNWLEAGNTIRVNESGTYRIYRFDTPGARGLDGNRPLALHVTAQTGNISSLSYWVGFRRTPNPGLQPPTGAYVLWDPAPTGNEGTRLLDMTRNTPNEARDAFLEINRTFVDPTGLINITPLQRGGTGQEQWIDLQVSLGVSGNRPPTVRLKVPSTAQARTPVEFRAQASDPDGDRLVYLWDFGDGSEVGGASTMSYRFVAGGKFPVSVTVSDLRGGDVTETIELEVADPLQPWTDHGIVSGQNVRSLAWWKDAYFALTSNQLHRSTDGATWERVTLPPEINFTYAKIAASPFGLVLVGRAWHAASSSWVGAVAESSDGIVWSRAELPPGTRPLNSAAFGNSMWVAVGQQGQILQQRRGLPWQVSPTAASVDLRDVAFGGNQFLVVGHSGTALRGSGNAPWSTIPGLPAQRNFIALANSGHLWAIGGNGVLLVSKNQGVSWESALPTTPWRTVDCLTFAGGMLYASAYHYETDLVTNTSILRREHLFWLEEGRTGFSPDTTPGQKASAIFAGERLLVGTVEGRVARSNKFRPPSSLVSGPATPSLQILSHRAHQRVFDSTLSLTGLLNARGGLPTLEFSIDGGVTWQEGVVYGNSTPYSWVVETPLEEGDNLLRLRATDESGRRSSITQFPLRYVVPAELTVWPDGEGRVPAPFLGTSIRDRGVPYTIAARPLRGMIFREWLLNGTSISRQNRLTFVLREDATLTPVFIPNPFPAAGGHFGGLIGPGEVTPAITPQEFAAENGFLSVFVSPTGNFSGHLLLGGERLVLRGKLDGFGEAEIRLARRGGEPLQARMQLALEGEPGLTGVILREGEELPFVLSRALPTGRGVVHPLAGRSFPFEIEAEGEGSTASLLLTTRPDGQALLLGTLPDATPIRATTRLLPDEDGWIFPVAIALPARTPGLILGELRAAADPAADPGELAWARWPSRQSATEFLHLLRAQSATPP